MIKVKEAFPDYGKPALAVDGVILRVVDVPEIGFNGTCDKCAQVLLIKKKGTDEKWSLPGGIMKLGETAEDVLNRVLREKTGIIGKVSYEQLYTIDDKPDRDERGHVVSVVYICKLDNNMVLDKNTHDKFNEEYEVMWAYVPKVLGGAFNTNKDSRKIVDKFNNEINELKYDHYDIIMDTMDRIKGKLMYTDIAFDFVGETFTIGELESVYTALNNSVISAFRRIIKPKIESTGEKINLNQHRPSEIYRKKN